MTTPLIRFINQSAPIINNIGYQKNYNLLHLKQEFPSQEFNDRIVEVKSYRTLGLGQITFLNYDLKKPELNLFSRIFSSSFYIYFLFNFGNIIASHDELAHFCIAIANKK